MWRAPQGTFKTKNGANLGNLVRVDTFSAENRVSQKKCEKRKKRGFFGQKSANFQNFSKIFWNLLETIEIHIWSKF